MKLSTSILILLPFALFGVSFENMNLQQEVNVNALQASNSSLYQTNNTTIIKESCISNEIMNQIPIDDSDGITFTVLDDGKINFNLDDVDFYGEATKRILINGKSLLDCIDERIALAMGGATTRSDITNIVTGIMHNPLWGKKLAVIGDSLISTPTRETSYPYYIAQRNNMTLIHNGRGSERLCTDYNSTNIACINSYSNDVPLDADFILCQIGANDSEMWNKDIRNNVDDTDMTTNTFKGCWNLLLIGLKTRYPNAKIGMILANNWIENLGQKSEDTIASETSSEEVSKKSRRQMTQWQKVQCQKLNIPVFDPVEDTRMFPYHYVQYPTNGTTITSTSIDDSALSWYDKTKRQIGTDGSWYKQGAEAWQFQSQYMRDTQHTTKEGNLYLSFYYEAWMKTVLAIE